MRRHELLLCALLLAVAVSACSRLTFIRPDASRGRSEQVAPVYDFQDRGRSDAKVSPRTQLLRAQQQLEANELDAAEASARGALKGDAKSSSAHAVLAVVASRRGRAREAGEHYARAAELSPASGAMLSNYGTWLCNNGRAAESIAWFDKALQDRAYANPASALANAGECSARAGQYGRVERDLRAALAQEPGNALALGAMAEEAFRTGHFMEARAFSERRLAVARPNAAVLLLASQIEAKLGDSAAAARYVHRLRTEFPQAPSVKSGESSSP